jgi:phosphatidylglycerophosphate synthase
MSKHIGVNIIYRDRVVIYICALVCWNKNNIWTSSLILRGSVLISGLYEFGYTPDHPVVEKILKSVPRPHNAGNWLFFCQYGPAGKKRLLVHLPSKLIYTETNHLKKSRRKFVLCIICLPRNTRIHTENNFQAMKPCLKIRHTSFSYTGGR